MSESVGFKKITIQVLDDKLKPVAANKFEISGITNEGAASSYEITGLSKESTKVYGSNVPYYTSQIGTGDVSATINILDLPFETEAVILGYNKSSDGVIRIGETTEAPYCAVLIESSTMQGKILGIGLYVGKFSKETLKGTTLNDEAYQPEATEYTFSAISRDFDGTGYTIGYAVDTAPFTSLTNDIIGTTTP